jgi:CubicO group peptidase (beta-lactamase class C family)
MKKFCSVFLLILLATSIFAQLPDKTMDFSKLEEAVLAELKEKRAAGAAIAIVRNDKIVFAKGFGTANIETNQPVTPDTLFQIGSVTKTFTALAATSFAAEGKLKLDAPIDIYAKNLSPKLSKVTLSQLLSHKAGIIDEPDEYGAQDESMMATYLRSWTDSYCLFGPGEIFSYSNSGFALAGFTMQEALGKPYVEIINERVFEPLGMKRTTFRPTVAMTYPLAVGHKVGERLAVVRPLPHDARLYPAGTFYTSGNDLARFAIAFLNNGKIDGKQIFSPNVIKQMSQSRAKMLSAADATSYGYGLFMNTSRGVHRTWHDGSMTGYTAQMMFVPNERFAVIVLSNTDGIVLNKTQEIAMALMFKLAPEETTKPKPVQSISEAEMQKLVGVYSQPNRWKIEISMKEGKLFIKQFNREMLLTKIGTDRFSFEFPKPGVVQEISFKIGADSKSIALSQYVWAFKRITTENQ